MEMRTNYLRIKSNKQTQAQYQNKKKKKKEKAADEIAL